MTHSASPNRNLLQRTLATGVVLYSATSAWAFQGPPGGNHHHGGGGGGGGGNGGGNGGGGHTNAPEVNPALLVGAFVLLVGAVLILSSRRQRAAGSSRA